MYTRILNSWLGFRASFWFIPTLLMLAAVVSAFTMIFIDKKFGERFIELYPSFEMSPPAARSILSSIVSAMVSTTGVVFSITIVALSLSSSHFGSRLIRTYRKRRTTHFTLGIFIATSLFCILVLASIREVNDLNFVPTASVVTGICLSVICLATLVYYIHDMSRAIEAPTVIQQSVDDLQAAIKRLFPESFGQGEGESDDQPQFGADDQSQIERLMNDARIQFNVQCDENSTGYLQAIDDESVMSIANQYDLLIKLCVRPGDFVYPNVALAKVFRSNDFEAAEDVPFDGDLNQFQDQVTRSLREAMIIGHERTHLQDVRHAFDEVVEIAVRALSPGINDPFTAVNCVDQIHAALKFLAGRKIPSGYRYSEKGQLRVIAQPVAVQECIDGSLAVIDKYVSDNPMVRDRIERALRSFNAK